MSAGHQLQNRFTIRRPDGSPALARADVLLDGRGAGVPDPGNYASVVDAMLLRNPPPRPVPGWPLRREALADALPDAYTRLRDAVAGSDLGGGWHMAVSVRTHFGTDFLGRARVARNWIGTLGIDEAMYIMAESDADGHALDGAHRYTLRFPPGGLPCVDAFWSITMYRRSDCLLVDNPMARYSIGDRTAGLARDDDGGLTIHIQAEPPGNRSNWLPSPKDEPFYLSLRLYQPREEHLERRFSYPPIRREE